MIGFRWSSHSRSTSWALSGVTTRRDWVHTPCHKVLKNAYDLITETPYTDDDIERNNAFRSLYRLAGDYILRDDHVVNPRTRKVYYSGRALLAKSDDAGNPIAVIDDLSWKHTLIKSIAGR